VALLREMTLCFPTVPALNEYSCLLSTDPEVDFFNNIVHLQVSFCSMPMYTGLWTCSYNIGFGDIGLHLL
jgi:hypothetical protein